MPRIPVYQSQGGSARLPSTPSSLGKGLRQLGRGLVGASQTISGAEEKAQKQRANTTVLESLDGFYTDWADVKKNARADGADLLEKTTTALNTWQDKALEGATSDHERAVIGNKFLGFSTRIKEEARTLANGMASSDAIKRFNDAVGGVERQLRDSGGSETIRLSLTKALTDTVKGFDIPGAEKKALP